MESLGYQVFLTADPIPGEFNIPTFPDSYTGVGNPIRSTYHINEYWSARYNHFQHVVPLCEAVWCVSPHQMDAYVALYGPTVVKLMPLVSWSKECSNPLQGKLERDIDFLFTGSVTPYREKVLGDLSNRGYRVMVGTTLWPRYMRDHFVARTKVCLQIRQDTGWMYPSIMRYHHLLCSGSVVVAQKTTESCLQESLIIVSDAARSNAFSLQTRARCELELNVAEFR